MKKIISMILVIALSLLTLISCQKELNDGSEDVLYNDIVYERSEWPSYNLELLSTNEKYIGDFLETYDYGQQLPWEVYVLNDEENVLYSAHALWLRPGYSLPAEYGEEFFKAEYVISEGLLDTYTEQTTPLTDFADGVTLADIIESEPTSLTEYTEHADVRLYYTDHADIVLLFGLYEASGVYYLNVCTVTGEDVFYAIKAEYVEALTAAVRAAQ